MKSRFHLTSWPVPAFLIAGVWQGCGVQSTLPSDSTPAGMTLILSTGKQTTLGSTDAWAKKDEETPRLTATFTYDFFIDRTEVTQALFDSLTGRNPATSNFGLGPDHPVYNVTWYDAALFCNARSKSEGLDTVYAYSGRKQDASGRVYDLPGLTPHYERRGYRLPTEAEWEFAARSGVSSSFPWGDAPDSATAVQMAWYTANSGGKTHPVGRLRANPNGLLDMAGNVMEWVNDWKGPYADVAVKDFLGSREPGVVVERVVKGGSFSYDFRYLRFSGRSANYATLSSAATEYVGFRCVLGAIANGQYLSGGQVHSATPAVTPEPSGVLELFGHNRVKLVFVNATSSTRTLCYIDFSESPVTAHEFLDDSTVFTPVISPDGQWVAYANVDEGDTKSGTVKFRKLVTGSVAQSLPVASAAIPRWWVNPGSQDTFLVYATTARDNTEPAWPSDQTYRVRVSGGAASGSPVLVSSGGYHDGFSNEGKHLVTGYRRLRVKNIVSGSECILFTGPVNGKAAGDTSQVCNVSIHPNFGTNPHVLLLDFGYTGVSSVVGRPYGLHEILFRVDTLGHVVRWYGAPQGFVAWQDVEWSNLGAYAVGVGEDPGQGHPAVVGANLADDATSVLARGATLREPGLWVKPGASIPPTNDPGVRDSMGQYNEPQRDDGQAQFAAKMGVFWIQRDSIEVVSLGSSHVECAIWPASFTHFHAANLGYSFGGLAASRQILQRYVLPNCPKLRAVIFEVHPGWFYRPDGDYNQMWKNEMSATLGYFYDQSHNFWNQGVPTFMDSLIRSRNLIASSFPYNNRGGISYPTQGWGVFPPVQLPGSDGPYPDSIEAANIQLLGDLAKETSNRGILFVMALFPQNPGYKNTPYYGAWGPTWALGRKVVSETKTLCEQIPNCRYYDAFQEGNHDYDSTMARDQSHLSGPGAIIFSHRLDSLIYKAIGPTN